MRKTLRNQPVLPVETRIVQVTFTMIEHDLEAAIKLFLQNCAEIDLRFQQITLEKSEIQALSESLRELTRTLHVSPNPALPVLVEAAAVKASITPDDWQIGCNALLLTLQEILKEVYTPQVQDAWISYWNEMYEVLIATLLPTHSYQDQTYP